MLTMSHKNHEAILEVEADFSKSYNGKRMLIY